MHGSPEQSKGVTAFAAAHEAVVEGTQSSFVALGTSQVPHSLQEFPSLTWLGKR